MHNILICGGAGFIGSFLTERLLARPDTNKVVVYDNLSSGADRLSGAVHADPKLAFIVGNARDYDALRSAVNRWEIDTCFHLAANPDISRATTEPTIDFDQGTVLTKNVLEACRVNGVRRVIYFSGSGIYGEPTHEFEAFAEHHGPNEPISTYGASKLAGEALLSAYCAMFGMVGWSFRFANVVGPRQTHGVGYDFLRRLKGDPTALKILGDGSQSKSYVFVDDIIRAVLLVCDRMTDDVIGDLLRGYDTYNVATSDALTVTQIAEMACTVMGLDHRQIAFQYTGGDRGWKGDVPRVRLNCGKIHSLGWRPEKNSRDAMYLALLAMREAMEKP